MLISIIALYLLGGLACYFVCRKIIWEKRQEDNWHAIEKIIVTIMSLLSWLTLFILLVVEVLIVIKLIDPDKLQRW